MIEEIQWVGVTEACKLLGISNMTLYKLVDEGVLPAYRVRGVKAMQFKRSDVLDLIERVEPKKKKIGKFPRSNYPPG